MSEVLPTRSAVLEMKEESRAMQDGYVFLDEKCLLLAGEMLRELARYTVLRETFGALHHRAITALERALHRHGLDALQVYPAADTAAALARVERRLMGVALQDAAWTAGPSATSRSIQHSPEAETCREAFLALLPVAAQLAAATGNLARLELEYRRAVRRARALHDVLLPELARTVAEVETRLEELEQEDAVSMRRGA